MAANSPLLTPVTLGDLKLKNRIALAPMTRARAGKERLPNSLMAEYYTQRSAAGLVLTEATTISPQGNGWNESPGIYTDAMIAGWKQTTESVHAAGGTIFLQLWHCGRASHSSFHDGAPAVAPSAVKLNGEYVHTPIGKQPYETPRALETAEVAATVNDYRQAALGAKSAGFDGVEVHGANGYLIDTFLQAKTNHRSDQYGGDATKRCRFLLELVEAVATVWPTNRMGVRISPNGSFNDMGSPDFREQFLTVAKLLEPFKLAYLHVMDGLGFGFHGLGEAMTLREFREVVTSKLIGNCGYDLPNAERAVADGAADMIAFGRPYISNPDLVARIANDWPWAKMAPISAWYSPIGTVGYTDFPTYQA
jgi:N-ethylmaleimide reductase